MWIQLLLYQVKLFNNDSHQHGERYWKHPNRPVDNITILYIVKEANTLLLRTVKQEWILSGQGQIMYMPHTCISFME